jgi:uncharacterized membrane protein YczE
MGIDLKEFISANKALLKKLVYLGLVILFLSFWVFYNIYRSNLGFTIYPSWGYGLLTAFGFTAGLITLIFLIVTHQEELGEFKNKHFER